MTTQEYVAADSTRDDGRSAIALGYAFMAMWGVVLGLVIAWVV